MRRAVVIALGVVVFAVISFGLARWLSTESTERNAILDLLRAQARGDARGMLDQLAPACRSDPRCRDTVQSDARRLRRPGSPKIIAYSSPTAYALGGARGTTRVAWTVIDGGLPVVQCVVVRREGTVLASRRVTIQRVSAPIGNESSC